MKDVKWHALGPEDVLRQTVNAQPAIMAVSLACLEAAREARLLGEPAFVAGHSLGEYTALVAAGTLDVEEGLRLEADLSALVATTEDSKEGPRAFAEKRAPVWKGK